MALRKKKIGEVIKAARIRHNMTADEVAAACNVSRSRVYQWESQTYVFPKNLPALAAALDLSIRTLKATNHRSRRV